MKKLKNETLYMEGVRKDNENDSGKNRRNSWELIRKTYIK